MKKYLSLVLAVVFLLAMAVPALADDKVIESKEGDQVSQDVTAAFTAHTDSESDTVYRMVIAWEYQNDNLAYTAEQSVFKWNTETLKYELDTDAEDYKEAGWSGSATVSVTVTNYSNAEVEATLTAENDYNLALTRPGDENKTLKSAAYTEEGEEIAFNDTQSQGKEVVAEFEYKFEASADADPIEGDTDVPAHNVGSVTITVAGK